MQSDSEVIQPGGAWKRSALRRIVMQYAATCRPTTSESSKPPSARGPSHRPVLRLAIFRLLKADNWLCSTRPVRIAN